MVRVLAAFSLERRGAAVPEEAWASSVEAFGELIMAFCTAEADSLLYNAVDRSIRRLL
jgi:hypothetical protein